MESWRTRTAAQHPGWPDPDGLTRIIDDLREAPPLVTADECDRLRGRLATVARGEAFVLQGGDCAETFDRPDAAAGVLRTLMQMAVVITYGAEVPVVPLGRMAGQYAKPRSSPVETRAGVTLPSYRGDAVNGQGFTPGDRVPDPARLRRMYEASAATMRQVRGSVGCGRPGLGVLQAWNSEFVAGSPLRSRYAPVLEQVSATLEFMASCRIRPAAMRLADFFVSHEALLLDYEAALVRRDPRTDELYAGSGHLLWVGERTRQVDGAHVDFAASVRNPVAVKLGSSTSADDALRLIDRLDPEREPGRLTFVTRMGSALVRDVLPTLVEKVAASGAPVVWVCDPMHGNTFTAPGGHKTRHFDAVLDEIQGFFEVHRSLGTHPGGVHLELTGDDVTECVGGGSPVTLDDLPRAYRTACDPRLNHDQALDLAFQISETLLRP